MSHNIRPTWDDPAVPLYLGADALARLDAEHDALCRQAGAHLTARSTWMRAVLACSDATPVYLEVHDGAQRRAGVTLAWRPGRLLHRVEGPGPGVTDSHWFPALDADAARRLAHEIDAFLGSLGRWQLQVDSAPPDDPCLVELRRLLPVHRVTPGDGMPRLRVGADRAIESYLSKSTRYRARRSQRAVADVGAELEVVTLADQAQIEAALPEVLQVHRARDHQLGRVSDVDNASYARLYRELVLRHAARGEVRLLTVRVDGALAAYQLMFRDGSALRMWDGRLNPAFDELGPAKLSCVEMVQGVLDDPELDELDFMRGEEPYKTAYTNEVVATVDLWAWSGRATRLPRVGYESLRELKRRSPALSQLWRRVRHRSAPS